WELRPRWCFSDLQVTVKSERKESISLMTVTGSVLSPATLRPCFRANSSGAIFLPARRHSVLSPAACRLFACRGRFHKGGLAEIGFTFMDLVDDWDFEVEKPLKGFMSC